MSLRYLPIDIDVRGREALVIGAGPEAARKIERLLEAGARVTVVAPHGLDAAVAARARAGDLVVRARPFELSDLDDAFVVFVDPAEDEALARTVHAWALRGGRLVGALDRPELSTFVSPAIASASGLALTVRTGGVSPGLAKRIREDLEALFAGERFGAFVDALRRLRASLPRGERAPRMKEAVRGFAVVARLRFPTWFERGDPGP